MATHSKMVQTRRRRKVGLKRAARIAKKTKKAGQGAPAKAPQSGS